MSDTTAQPDLTLSPFEVRPLHEIMPKADRRFGLGLLLAIVLHLSFIVGFNSTGQREIGDPTGVKEALSVEFVTESDLKQLATAPDKAAGQPIPPPTPPQEQAKPPPPEPPTPPQPQVQPQPAAPPPPAEEMPLPENLTKIDPGLDLKPRPPHKAAEPSAQPEQNARATQPVEATKQENAKSRPAKPDQPTRTLRLDVAPPPITFSAPFGSGGAGVERPAGATKSGENDAFARGVISALRQTMPQLRDSIGRVSVRITLDKDGSLVSTQVIRPSGVPGLDQNVVFATRQSSFPFPPRNARPADLVFLVTYIYR